MKRKNRIFLILTEKFPEWKIQINDISNLHKGHHGFDGNQETHFSITLKSQNNNNEKTILLHRKINKLLENEFDSGLHALEIKIIR